MSVSISFRTLSELNAQVGPGFENFKEGVSVLSTPAEGLGVHVNIIVREGNNFCAITFDDFISLSAMILRLQLANEDLENSPKGKETKK